MGKVQDGEATGGGNHITIRREFERSFSPTPKHKAVILQAQAAFVQHRERQRTIFEICFGYVDLYIVMLASVRNVYFPVF